VQAVRINVFNVIIMRNIHNMLVNYVHLVLVTIYYNASKYVSINKVSIN